MIKAVTGTKDILPDEITRWYYLEEIIKKTFLSYNYKEIRTPVFEETALFARGIGEQTDIVGKEMYTFTDRSETSLTLKPEMTASVVRAYIEHSLASKQQLNKLFYISPMFRQERPQAGRLRQFHQFGAEALGSTSPALDAEMIQMAFDILVQMGLKDISVKINSLGVPETREKYKSVLRDYLSGFKDKLSEDSKKRFDKNILRIFDSKDENDQVLLKNAPLLIEYLDNESKDDLDIVKSLLDSSNIPYEVDSSLVRGLDYYTKTTFEILSGKVGSQAALCGGGRYDLLVEQLGGKPSPGVGFAAGMERILLACENEKSFSAEPDSIDIYIIRLEKDLSFKCFELAALLRRKGLSVDTDYSERSVKAQMREANKFNAKFSVFVGGDEYKQGKVVLKKMDDGTQSLFELNDINTLIKAAGG